MMSKTKILWVLSGILFILLVAGCRSTLLAETQTPFTTETLVDSGSWYSRETWPHDGNPYESSNFIIYSDSASLESRQALADIAEELLAELITGFGIDQEDMLRYPPGQDRIHIYAYKDYYPKQWGMRAYYGGIIAWSLDHEHRNTNLRNYKPVLKHELVHVIESLLKGRDVANMSPAVRTQAWFSEGLAEAVVGGTSGNLVKGREQLELLTAQYGDLNPIAYKTDGVLNEAQETHPRIGFNYYYPMSQLAVEYLLDAEGLGKSLFDVRDIFLDMAEGVDFSTAFGTHLGVSVQAYEADFFDLMDGYLEKGSASIFIRLLGLWAILSLLSILLVAWQLIRNKKQVQGLRWTWLLLTALFGPLGLVVYLISERSKKLEPSNSWRGLVAAMFSATGNGLGLLIVIYYLRFFAPDAESGPLIILAPFLVSWLIFRGPQLSSRTGLSYGRALYRSVIGELGSTVLVLAGLLPILIVLPDQVWLFSAGPTHPHFWGLISLGVIAGTLLAFPLSFWMVHRESVRSNRLEV